MSQGKAETLLLSRMHNESLFIFIQMMQGDQNRYFKTR